MERIVIIVIFYRYLVHDKYTYLHTAVHVYEVPVLSTFMLYTVHVFYFKI